ncbi:PO113 protein, partial [Podargus strigoides]|nr:PO113 protein [Podargus strigoides]
SSQSFEDFPKRSEVPVAGQTFFTDASKQNKKAAITWQQHGKWKDHIIEKHTGSSLQTLELAAVVWVFQQWKEDPINIVSDSLYVVGVVRRVERSVLKELHNPVLSELFL